MLKSTAQPLRHSHDLVMLDLDGVVYRGTDAVPGAVEALAALRADRLRTAFVTNNAARPPEAVAAHLNRLGVEADSADVVTSAQAAARIMLGVVGPDARVLALAGPGVHLALEECGLQPVSSVEDEPEAVLTGYGPDLTWKQVMQAAILIRTGVPWVASNADLTLPTAYGLGPGHGALVRLLSDFADRQPVIAGKPHRGLFDEVLARTAGRAPLMVGDRLDTDIRGAAAAGIDSLLVLTGVAGLEEIVAAPPAERPSYVSSDLGGLLRPHPPVTRSRGRWESGGWTVEVSAGSLQVTGRGDVDAWWRAVAAAAWQHLDETSRPVDARAVVPPATGSREA